MRLAHFIHRYPPAFGGSESYCARLSEYLVRQGHDVEVWTSTARQLSSLWQRHDDEFPMGTATVNGVSVRRFAPTRFPLRRYAFKAWSMLPMPRWSAWASPCNPTSLAQWKAVDRAERVDATHAFAFPYTFPALCAWKLAKRWDVPFYLTPFLHLGSSWKIDDPTRRQYTRPAMRWLLNEASGIFVQTQSEADAVASMGVPMARIHLQGLGVDPSECTGGNRMRARRLWGVSNDDVVIGHLANLSEEKGTIDLLATVHWLHVRGVPYRVVLGGVAMPNFEQFWKSYPLRSRVIRLGPITELQKRDFYAGIDLFALLSHSDSFGLVLLEAWANAVPNVVAQYTVLESLIRNGHDGVSINLNGRIMQPRGLQKLVESAAERQRMGQAGAKRIASGEFDWNAKLHIVEAVVTQPSRGFGGSRGFANDS